MINSEGTQSMDEMFDEVTLLFQLYTEQTKEVKATENDLKEWIQTLPNQVVALLKNKTLIEFENVSPFIKFVNTKNGFNKDNWIKENVNCSDNRVVEMLFFQEYRELIFKRSQKPSSNKYWDIVLKCKKQLVDLMEILSVADYNKYKKNFGADFPLGYEILFKRVKMDENWMPGIPDDYCWIDMNGIISEMSSDFKIALTSAKRRGSINPFNWSKEDIELIEKNERFTKAKTRKEPLVKDGIIYGSVIIPKRK